MKVKIILDDGREVEAEISQEEIDKACDKDIPKDGQEFWYIDPYFGAADATWDGSEIDICLYKYGNYFKTEQEAKDRVAYIGAENTLRRAIAKANDGWVYKPYTNKAVGRFVVIDSYGGVAVNYSSHTIKVPIWFYIKTGDLAAQLMEEYEKEFRIYLGA